MEELDKAIKILIKALARPGDRAELEKQIKQALRHLELQKKHLPKPTNITR